MIFKKDAQPVASDDFWYDLFDGGYIKPQKLLENSSDIEKVETAIGILEDFKTTMENAGLLEEM
ncbi:MAG: hypothetical protein KAS32_16655 [Candidatus Peribacteraceae bacterium]|nr:hypothetical protein [Candidatus Peribacteraceae bacterium]